MKSKDLIKLYEAMNNTNKALKGVNKVLSEQLELFEYLLRQQLRNEFPNHQPQPKMKYYVPSK